VFCKIHTSGTRQRSTEVVSSVVVHRLKFFMYSDRFTRTKRVQSRYGFYFYMRQLHIGITEAVFCVTMKKPQYIQHKAQNDISLERELWMPFQQCLLLSTSRTCGSTGVSVFVRDLSWRLTLLTEIVFRFFFSSYR
jgi:hypothetical protein